MTQRTAVETAEKNETADEITLTDELLQRFDGDLQSNGKKAYGRWGFALFHSLPDERAIEELTALGLKPRDYLDHYNLGCHLAAREKYDEAAREFAEALKGKPDFFEARFNQALAKEKAGDLNGAKKIWNDLIENSEEDDEIAEIKNHLNELSAG